jgi:hypothetical protein
MLRHDIGIKGERSTSIKVVKDAESRCGGQGSLALRVHKIAARVKAVGFDSWEGKPQTERDLMWVADEGCELFGLA